jgi:hypothetical protein
MISAGLKRKVFFTASRILASAISPVPKVSRWMLVGSGWPMA